MKQRVLAIIGAIGLVVIAVVIRQQLSGNDSGGGRQEPKPGGKSDSTLPVVACTPDLSSICEALVDQDAIAKDPPTFDLDEAVKPPAEVDGWITWEPAPQVVNPEVAGNQWGNIRTIASAPLAVSSSKEGRAAIQKAECRVEPVDAGCLAEAASGRSITLGVGSGTAAESLARFTPTAPTFVDDTGKANRGLLDTIVGEASAGGAAQQVTDQTRPGLGADAVFGPRPLLDRIARTPQGVQRELEVANVGGRSLKVVLASRTDRDLAEVVSAAKDDALKPARSALGMTSTSDPGDKPIDDGAMYQVWKALR